MEHHWRESFSFHWIHCV